MPRPATQLTRTTDVPEWAAAHVNLRGRLPLSSSHFTGVVALTAGGPAKAGGAVLEALLDTGGARTMIDETTARLAKLPMRRATKERDCGWFYSPSGEATPYVGTIEGPVTVRFSKDVVIEVAEVKVVANKEPMVLIGTDTMVAPDDDRAWRFAHVGLDHRTRGGIV